MKINIETHFYRKTILMTFNGFQKKTQKTPKQEIEKGERIKAEYFEEKNKIVKVNK